MAFEDLEDALRMLQCFVAFVDFGLAGPEVLGLFGVRFSYLMRSTLAAFDALIGPAIAIVLTLIVLPAAK